MKSFDRIVSSARADERMQNIINGHLGKDGHQSHFVFGLAFKGKKQDPPAFSVGAEIFRSPIGWISVSESLHRTLTEEELEFVVLHELGHIVKNHSVGTLIVLLGKGYIMDLLGDAFDLTARQARETLGLIKAIWAFFNKRTGTVEEEISARQEFEADRYAVMHQDRKEPAISVLNKLTKGNIKRLTHFTMDGRFVFPVVTAEQRIEAIRNLHLSSLVFGYPTSYY